MELPVCQRRNEMALKHNGSGMRPFTVWPGLGNLHCYELTVGGPSPLHSTASQLELAWRCALGHRQLRTFPADSWQLDFIVLTFATRKTY